MNAFLLIEKAKKDSKQQHYARRRGWKVNIGKTNMSEVSSSRKGLTERSCQMRLKQKERERERESNKVNILVAFSTRLG